MNGRFDETRRGMFARFAGALVFTVGIRFSAFAAPLVSYTAKSGVPTECHAGGYWRVDANGKVWPVTIQFMARPKNGTATAQVTTGQRPLRNGEVKTVRLTQVIYQSRKGFVGEDSFTYRRITADPTDPNNGKEYTVAVTVR